MKELFCHAHMGMYFEKDHGGKANNKNYCNLCWMSKNKDVDKAKIKASAIKAQLTDIKVTDEVSSKEESPRHKIEDKMFQREINKINDLESYWSDS